MLGRIENLHVETHDSPRRIPEQGPRPGRKILQAGADGEDYVRRLGRRVGGTRAGDAKPAQIERMVVRQRALPGLRFGDRDAVALNVSRKRSRRAGIVNAASGDDERLPSRGNQACGIFEFTPIRRRAPPAPDALGEEALRIRESLGLRVLAQRERDRAASGGIGKDAHGPRQGSKNLLGPSDAIEVPRDRPQAVIGRHGAVAKILDLLQHRIGAAAREYVARQEQYGQPIDMGNRRGRHHVGRPGSDRAGARHHALPPRGLGEGDGRVRHCLLVVRPEGRQDLARLPQRLAQSGDVAVAEDRPDAGKKRLDASVELGSLGREIAHHRLCRGEAEGGHWHRLP